MLRYRHRPIKKLRYSQEPIRFNSLICFDTDQDQSKCLDRVKHLLNN